MIKLARKSIKPSSGRVSDIKSMLRLHIVQVNHNVRYTAQKRDWYLY